MKSVLVTQIRYKQSIAIMKSLQAAGFYIYGADNMRFPSGRFSRYCNRFIQYRCPINDEAGFIEDILSIAKQYNISSIVPGFSEILALSKNITRLEQAGITCLVDHYKKLNNANNKSWVMKTCEEIGISIPKTWYPKTIADVEAIANHHKGKVMIKALSGKGGEDLIVVDHLQQLTTIYQSQSKGLPLEQWPIIQEFIEIESTCCTGHLFNKGHLVAEHSYTVTRTLNQGVPIDRLSTHHAKLLETGRKLLSHMQWHGIAQVDFIIEKGTGRPCLLEINPRFWASTANAISSGVDFPKLVMEINQHSKPLNTPELSFTQNMRTIWFFPYMVSLLQHLKALNWAESKRHFCNPLADNIHFDDVSIKDPLPALMEPFIGLYFIIKNGGLRQD